MSRKDSLLRLHERLIAKRDTLRKKLTGDFDRTQAAVSPQRGGDLGDAAIDGESEELSTQLAALESRELNQIERAIHQIRLGRYGTCEMCDKPIPIERLRALPFTPVCVNCQRVYEEHRENGSGFEPDWESAHEFEGRLSDRELTLGDIDID